MASKMKMSKVKLRLKQFLRQWVQNMISISPEGKFFTLDFLEVQANHYNWHIGKNTYGNPKIIGAGRAHLQIGDYCSIADDVTLILANHNTGHISTYPFMNIFKHESGNLDQLDLHARSNGAIDIGNDVWIGQGATIFSGVAIGNGAVIGAGSFVRSDVPDYAIVIGNPSQVIRYRFSPKTILKLLEISWWNWEPDLVIKNKDIFLLSEQDFFQELERRKLV